MNLSSRYGTTYRITHLDPDQIRFLPDENHACLENIQGRFGFIYMQREETIGVWVRTSHDSSDRLGRLLAIPGARHIQRIGLESLISIPLEYLPLAGEIIQAKRLVSLAEEHFAGLSDASEPLRSRTGAEGR